MAYDGGYGGPQRAHAGPAAQRPPPRGYGEAPPPQQYGAPQQYEGGYDQGYGYDDYNGGYGQDNGGQYQDPSYQQGPPPQDYGGGRGGRPMPGARGPPQPRGPGPGSGQGMQNGHGPGRVLRRPAPQKTNSDPASGRRPPMASPPVSPRGPGFGGGGYPPFPGPDKKMGPGYEQQMAGQMSGMDMGSRMPPGGRPSSEGQRGQNDYGRPAPRGQAPHGYPVPRRGPPPGQGSGPGGYDDGYGRGPPRNDFAPPDRSMTMPANDPGMRRMPPQRMETMPFDGPAGRGMQPPRPSTATGTRPPPQRMYPPNARGPALGPHGGQYDDSQGRGQHPNASVDDVYDSYYQNDRTSDPGYGSRHQHNQSSVPDFDAISQQPARESFEQTMRPGPDYSQAGPHQTASLNHAKSQPDLRQPQAAVFEMAGDAPAMPPLPQANAYGADQGRGYNSPGGYDQISRGPSAPPGPVPGPNHNMPGARPGPGITGSRSADGLPSHPTPVRPGLMANSMVNLNEKPPPMRNYGGVPQAGPPQAQYQPQRPPPPQQQQQQMPQQAIPPVQQQQQQQPTEAPVTAQELEQLRMTIKNNPNDQESALRLAKRLLEAADVLVPALPNPKARGQARERYVMDAHKVLKKLSNAQNVDAMFLMADSLGKGLFGNESDNKEAFTLYQSAAKLGHAAAAYRTAVCCEIGHEEGGGTRKDPMKAIQWYKRSATLGDPPAMYKMGMIQLKGLLGQPRNPREAVGWLKRAAAQADSENPHALHELGLLYESAQPNDTIIRDERYAFTLFQQAAELGYKFSQFRLGCTYEYGLMGCPIDPRLSIMWYSKAATQAEHQSELALSGWYLTGSEGVMAQNDTEAYLWARKAAVAGLAKAEYAMGYFTEVGIGVPANLEDAKRWYWRAAAQDFPKARDRLEDLKRVGKTSGPRQRERISRSRIEKQQQDGECSVM